jgi:hypothetical protein
VRISNQFNPGNLYAVGEGEPVQFGTAFDTPGNQWTPWPSYPLRGILAEQPEGFPQFDGDEAKAYDCINNYLNLYGTCELGGGQVNAGLRCEYSILGAPQSYTIPDVPPMGCSASAQSYDRVRTQLNGELAAAIAVQNLYLAYNDFVNSVFIENSAQLGPLIEAAGLDQDASVTFNPVGLIIGVVYSIMSLGDPALGFAANLMEAAYAGVEGLNVPPSALSPFEVAVSDVQTELSDRFASVLAALDAQQSFILTNGHVMQQVATLASKTDSPDALGIDPAKMPALLQNARAGFAVATMQVLLPAKYQVTRALAQVDTNAFSGLSFPSYTRWDEKVGIQTSSEPLYNSYGISDPYGLPYDGPIDPKGFPSEAAIQTDVFDNGTTQHDFFTGTNGWEGFNKARTPRAITPSATGSRL